jgi:D-sedoheptulose 7-phosphate isomerase
MCPAGRLECLVLDSKPEYADEMASPTASQLFEQRNDPASTLASQAGAVAAACHAMALRFHQGGKLIVFGTGLASTDAQHVAVEFVHPVIVGKRALPAICLTTDVATVTGIAEREGITAIFARQIRLLARPEDIALGIVADAVLAGESAGSVLAGLSTAKEMGLLTIALAGAAAAGWPADHLITTGASDPRIAKEMNVTVYHVLWELVHVFLEQPGVLDPGVIS